MLELWSRQKFDLQVWPWPWAYLNKCFKWHIYTWQRTIVKLFWNPSTNAEVIVHTNSDTLTLTWMDGHTHIHRTSIVTTISPSASWLIKNHFNSISVMSLQTKQLSIAKTFHFFCSQSYQQFQIVMLCLSVIRNHHCNVTLHTKWFKPVT